MQWRRKYVIGLECGFCGLTAGFKILANTIRDRKSPYSQMDNIPTRTVLSKIETYVKKY